MSSVKRALIFGICGQDGSYLAHSLLKKGFNVCGTSRDSFIANKTNLEKLRIDKEVEIFSAQINDFRSVLCTIKDTSPDYIFHMAGQTSVGLSFSMPFESIESISISTLNILESVRFIGKNIRIFIPCSSECFGNNSQDDPADETKVLNPLSPYAVAKCSSFWLSKSYRDSYGMHISVAFLSNHESPLRGSKFVMSKLFREIKKIEEKKISRINFGDIDIIRDWGWAPDYIEAIIDIINYENPEEFIIGTGTSVTLRKIIQKAFALIGINDYQNYISSKEIEKRPNDLRTSYLNPSKALNKLNWKSKTDIDALITKLYHNLLF
ncbi:MAG: GDP-mannose 4,6-dehydratase [Pelagibacteraceae bacterium TMED124]|nr:MAG: GDP-mannose 4,6-dehydratase [Pelagibacteraceae bacterium TMED124]